MMPTAELLVMETTRSAACPKQLSTKRNRRKRMNVSVLEAGFLWRVRVLQGPAARHGRITFGSSVVQVRMASPGCLTDGCPNVHPTNLDC